MTPKHPRILLVPRALGIAACALLMLPALAGCKLVETGSDGLSVGVPVGYAPVPDELVGTFWGGQDDQCSYAFGFPTKDGQESLLKCRVPNSQETVTSQVIRRVGFKREADTDGITTWSVYAPAGFISSSCAKLPQDARDADSTLARLNGTGDQRRLETAYRKGHWLPSAPADAARVAQLRQEATAGPGCQPQDQ